MSETASDADGELDGRAGEARLSRMLVLRLRLLLLLRLRLLLLLADGWR